MPPVLALGLCLLLLVWLFRTDVRDAAGVSAALWLPLIWFTLVGSRGPAQWLGVQSTTSVVSAFEEGNSLDRTVLLTLIGLAFVVLLKRPLKWGDVLSTNRALVIFLAFGLLSVSWSDYPFVAFKRWIRDLGHFVMVLTVLSDPHPLDAINVLIRRMSYVLVSLSIVFIKYFPEIAVYYDTWTGTPDYAGVATSKNTLAAICLISGLFFFWDTVRRWPDRQRPSAKQMIIFNIIFLGLTIWLLRYAQSATARSCLLIGCALVIVVQSRWAQKNYKRLTVAIPVGLLMGLFLQLTLNVSSTVAELLGRDPTLTGRTEIWAVLLDTHTNVWLGQGYESFWLGDRLVSIWTRLGTGFLNEAHNGYLETFLNLGAVGVALLGIFLIASYRTICQRLATCLNFGALGVAVWTVLLIYNVTEAAFKASLPWCIFLLFAVNLTALVPLSPPPAFPAARRRPAIPPTRFAGERP